VDPWFLAGAHLDGVIGYEEHGKVEVGAEILLRIAREFGRSMEWLLTGEDRR